MSAPPNTRPCESNPQDSECLTRLHPGLVTAFRSKGYVDLTPVQREVLSPGLQNKDLRITSQTGSGKTLAIGFALQEVMVEPMPARSAGRPLALPRAMVIVPTRELARQVELELAWLYAPLRVRVTSVAGGAAYREELKALGRDPALVVGTPGRLLDHLRQGTIGTQEIAAVVLDEADQMLDLGFRDELDSILEQMPEQRRTHLVSATFAREVRRLADRIQSDVARVEGTPLGTANTDIQHVVHVVEGKQLVSALVNVLLLHPDQQTLVFARTRADVADVARELSSAGFAAGALSGEMDQSARNGALLAFKRGQLRILVATDVAARGIDVQNVLRVVHLDVPANADSYTHRSGRTGRAGRKGTSVLLVTLHGLRRSERVLSEAGVEYRLEAVPSARAIETSQDERWLSSLEAGSERAASARVQAQLERILAAGQTELALAKLLGDLHQTQGQPRSVDPVALETRRRRDKRSPGPGLPRRHSFDRRGSASRDEQKWVSFSVSCGRLHGADPRRLVAMLCRRGKIKGTDLGAIRVGAKASEVEVAKDVADSFARAASLPDPRNPRVNVAPARAERGFIKQRSKQRATRVDAAKAGPRGKHPASKSSSRQASV